MFYSGEVPGMTFTNVNMADSREDCIAELKEKYAEHKGSMFDKTSDMTLDKIKAKYPNHEVIRLK